MELSSAVTSLNGIGEKTARKFAAAGIYTLQDLISYYPRDYETFDPCEDGEDELTDGRVSAVCAFLRKPLSVRYAGRYKITTGSISAFGKEIRLVWFNMPYLKNTLRPGSRYVFRGRVKRTRNTISLQQPKVYPPDEYEKLAGVLRPVYRLHQGLTEGMIDRAVSRALEVLEEKTPPDHLPLRYMERFGLVPYLQAVRWMHFPDSKEHYMQGRRRIAFDEFLLFILAVRRYRILQGGVRQGRALMPETMTGQFLDSLPYQLTGAQKRVWDEVRSDLQKTEVMGRLIQGDVGSGKTVVAFLALIMTAAGYAQGALMVPTEVLARQHFETFQRMIDRAGLPVKAVLLTGSLKAAEKRKARDMIESGEAQVIIGTHALFQEKVSCRDLALCVVDEQHRFGVRQREALSFKGMNPHILLMSATPIPRTLAALLYADLQVSVIDEMPAGRLPIKNCVVDPSWRPKAYSFIAKQVAQGRQAYIICPIIEESEETDLADVENYTISLREALPENVRVDCLHGRMNAAEKNQRMEDFAAGKIQVLVSTTVVEVGVDVSNATVMMIEDAQRFGLAQLHQLRGRVGRGEHQSYCIMVDTSGRKEPDPRLAVMNVSNDGFEIAREDLKLRGPGDLLGVRQSGELGFTVADVFSDASVLQEAAQTADEIIREDAQLTLPEHAALYEKMTAYLEDSPQNIYV